MESISPGWVHENQWKPPVHGKFMGWCWHETITLKPQNLNKPYKRHHPSWDCLGDQNTNIAEDKMGDSTNKYRNYPKLFGLLPGQIFTTKYQLSLWEFLEPRVSNLIIAPPIGAWQFLTAVKHINISWNNVKHWEAMWDSVRQCDERMWKHCETWSWGMSYNSPLASAVQRAWHQKVQQFTRQPLSKGFRAGS